MAFKYENSGYIILLIQRLMACIKEIIQLFVRMNIMEEISQIRSCVEILANDDEIYTSDQYMFYS